MPFNLENDQFYEFGKLLKLKNDMFSKIINKPKYISISEKEANRDYNDLSEKEIVFIEKSRFINEKFLKAQTYYQNNKNDSKFRNLNEEISILLDEIKIILNDIEWD